MTESNSIPPLPPPRLEDLQASAPSRTPLVVVAIAALLAAGLMGLLWLGARSSGNDAATERDTAIAERDAANNATLDTDTQLRAAQDELAAARAALEDASDSPDAPSPEELTALQDEADASDAEVERLEDENATLEDELADAKAAVVDAQASATTTVPAPDVTTTTTPATTVPAEPTPDTTAVAPVSADDIGHQTSGLFRNRVLGAVQKECLGQVVLNDLGQQRVVEAIASESPGDDEEFVQAIRDAAAFCNIAPSAIFG